jgi:aryl-alcohol dehydrogenase-like predicted oxidoreductase
VHYYSAICASKQGVKPCFALRWCNQTQEHVMAERTIRFGEHSAVPAYRAGTWYMGENPARAQEVRCTARGHRSCLTVIDTAEMYADGGAEEVVGEAIRAGARERVVLVSKVRGMLAAQAK